MTHTNPPRNHLLRISKACYNCLKGKLIMSVSITLPPPLEESLRREIADLDQHAKEALLIDLYRKERITKHQLATALGMTRIEVNDVLNRWNVTEDLPTVDEIFQDAEKLAELRKQQG